MSATALPPLLPPGTTNDDFVGSRWTRHQGFTLVELLTAIAVIVILAAIMIPAVVGVRRATVRSQCSSNLRQNAMAYILWAGEHKGKIPNTYSFGRASNLANDDLQLGTSLYLGAPNANLHAVVELSPVALQNETVASRFQDSSKSGFYRAGSYYPIPIIWNLTNTINEPMARANIVLPPPRGVLLGVAKTTLLATNGSGFNPNIQLQSWTVDSRFEDYGGDSVLLAFFDGHVESVSKDKAPKVLVPDP